MKQLLDRLLEAEILTPESRKELEDDFNAQLDTAKEAAAADVRLELTEAFVSEKERLVEAVDTKLTEMFEAEITELKEDFEAFRDLEAEYAEKLVEAKASMGVALQEDMDQLVNKIDAFIEIKLTEEVQELREDIKRAKENNFGRQIFEAMASEFSAQYHNADADAVTYAEMENRLNQVQVALEESEKKKEDLERTIKLDSILSPLSGTDREVMEQLLQNVATKRLQEGYTLFLPRVIRETKEVSEKEVESVLSESAQVNESEVTDVEPTVVTGDVESSVAETELVNESAGSISTSDMERLQRLAGIRD